MMSSAAVLAKTFRATRKPFRARAKTVRLPVGIAVRLQPGILFVFTPESFSRSPRNPFRLAPESAEGKTSQVLMTFRFAESGRALNALLTFPFSLTTNSGLAAGIGGGGGRKVSSKGI